jgi:hypothetical protein
MPKWWTCQVGRDQCEVGRPPLARVGLALLTLAFPRHLHPDLAHAQIVRDDHRPAGLALGWPGWVLAWSGQGLAPRSAGPSPGRPGQGRFGQPPLWLDIVHLAIKAPVEGRDCLARNPTLNFVEFSFIFNTNRVSTSSESLHRIFNKTRGTRLVVRVITW